MQNRLSLSILVCLSLIGGALSLAATSAPVAPQPHEPPQTQALNAWKAHLTNISWPKGLRDRLAPKLLGTLSKVAHNEHGGKTYTFDGSQPGMLATVTLVLDASGKAVKPPVVMFADVVEAR
ncbi:MAG: hypothetical protein KAI24_09975 [Planctomycetes bacterium]|nr:hypothetical protein [Planctomycetota bacterium]